MAVQNVSPKLWREDLNPLRSLRQEMDDLFESWTKGLSLPQVSWSTSQLWPRMNVCETDKELQITTELPGVDQKNVEITLTGNDLTIKGEKKSEIDEKKDEQGRAYHRFERSFGSFERHLSLPFDVDSNKVQASFKDGLLSLTIPKPAEAQKATKRIEIKNEKQIESKKAA